MRKKVLQPGQIVVPAEYELGDESSLKRYFEMYHYGQGDVPPIIVAKANTIKEKERQQRLRNRLHRIDKWGAMSPLNYLQATHYIASIQDEFRWYSTLIKHAPYCLLDGNHRSTAATLTHSPIQAIELHCDEDVAQIKKMIEEGDLSGHGSLETSHSLRDLVLSFEEFCLGGKTTLNNMGRMKDVRTVKDRIDKLVSEGRLPRYMAEQYLHGQSH